MNRTTLAKILVVVLGTAFATGCSLMSKGPTDEELVQGAVNAWKDGLLNKDVEAVMKTISEDFYHPDGGDKEGLRHFLQQAMDSGYFDDAEVDVAGAAKPQIDKKKGEAIVYPLVLSSPKGSVTVELTLKKEDKNWLIALMDVEGL